MAPPGRVKAGGAVCPGADSTVFISKKVRSAKAGRAFLLFLTFDRKVLSSPISRFRLASLAGTLRWGNFLTGQKVTKDPPKAGPSPALWNPPRGTGRMCVLLFSALGPVGSHRWRGHSVERASSSVCLFLYRQGLTLVSRCSQLSGAWLPAAGTPLLQGRPGCGDGPAIGPAA